MAEIRLTKLSKTYPNGQAAVKDLDLSIKDGEFLVLVGPSGCGKSTVLRMIAGLEEITGGTLHIGDRLVNEVEPKERDIAMVFQSYALYPHMTVAENIGFPLRLSRVAKAEKDRRVREAAAILELTDYLDRRPAQLSGGQRQRVAMGRAIVRQPSVYLLDEPLSNLDAKLRDKTRTEMVDLQARLGVTTVYVTHDQVEAMTMGDRVAVMKDGVLQQCATPRELYASPANAFVAGFIGTPAMNFLPADVTAQGLTAAGLTVALPGELRAVLDRQSHSQVQLGVRPEDVKLGESGSPARVIGVEELGPEAIVRLALPDAHARRQLIVRVPGDTLLTRDETVHFNFGPKVHVFTEDGQRIAATN